MWVNIVITFSSWCERPLKFGWESFVLSYFNPFPTSGLFRVYLYLPPSFRRYSSEVTYSFILQMAEFRT
jgi:hypothetical protein